MFSLRRDIGSHECRSHEQISVAMVQTLSSGAHHRVEVRGIDRRDHEGELRRFNVTICSAAKKVLERVEDAIYAISVSRWPLSPS